MSAGYASRLEGLSIKAHAFHCDPGKIGTQLAKSRWFLIHNSYRMAPLVEPGGKQRAHATTAQNHNMHVHTVHAGAVAMQGNL